MSDIHGADAGHDAKLKNPDGSWKYTNALAKESSPYLLQHAHNPVDWYAWGPEAFELARKTGKPIFLSIGYSTCYWCHVMERESFENPQIAAIINEHFVPVKVDREERPDVDDIYMAATIMFNQGQGGWPMSVFLTPPGAKGPDDQGLKPFFAGTYFPPVSKFGRMGFPDLLERIATVWKDQRGDVLATADRAADAVREHLAAAPTPGDLAPQIVQTAANQLVRMYDPTHGGFSGPKGPKFPTPNNLGLLLKVHENNPNEELWQAITHTLERMARGGMYDQVGGGFHRYSVDEKWLVPHFEKMLYDNGQLLELYLTAHEMKPHPDDADLYARVARETAEYVLREMRDETGTFWSAQDAEVDSREGLNYVWTPQQMREAIEDQALAELALEMYGLDKSTNFQDPHHPQEPPTNVLYLPQRLDELARERGMTLDELLAKKQAIDAKLYDARMHRKQPGTDDKVLTAWNGLMIAGLAKAGRALDEPRFTQAAAQAAGYILEHMRTADGGLYRSMRNGSARIDAFLEDYAFLIHGLVALHRADENERWLNAARELTDIVEKRFAAKDGGYFDTLADQADLFVRTRSTYDGAVPSGNSQMIHDLVDLYEITSDDKYLNLALDDLKAFATDLREKGANMSHMQRALLRIMEYVPNERLASAGATGAAEGKAAATAPGQARTVLNLSVEPSRIKLANEKTDVTITLSISDGFHLNAHQPGDDNLIPTALSLEQGKGLELKVSYPAGEQKKYPFADQPLRVYEGKVTLQATIRRTGDVAPSARPILVLRYQACTEQACLAPKEIEVPVIFE